MTQSRERVQITLHAQKLKNVAGAFKGTSDPYAVCTIIANEPGEQPQVLGKTEVIKNNLSPHWTKTFEIDYEFSKPTRLNIGIYDEVRKAGNNKPMGTAVFEIGEVLGARGNIKAKKLKNGGTLFCRIKKAAEANNGTFHFQLRGVKLKNVGKVKARLNHLRQTIECKSSRMSCHSIHDTQMVYLARATPSLKFPNRLTLVVVQPGK